MFANDQSQIVKEQMLLFLTACESCKYLSKDVKENFEERLNDQDADIYVVCRDFLKMHVAKNDELLGYFADYLAKVEHKEFSNLFFEANTSLTLNLTIVPGLKNFNATSDTQDSGYLCRGWQRFQTKHLKVNLPASEETSGREYYSITPFWRTNYAKEPREQLKVALLDLSTPTNEQLVSGRQLQALKNDIYGIVFQYKENIRSSGAWFRTTGLERAQTLQEAVALAKNVEQVKAALSTCFSYSAWKPIAQDSLVACFAGNPGFKKNAEKELGIDVPNLLKQPVVKTCWTSSCFRPNKVQPVVEPNNFDALKASFKGIGAVRN